MDDTLEVLGELEELEATLEDVVKSDELVVLTGEVVSVYVIV